MAKREEHRMNKRSIWILVLTLSLVVTQAFVMFGNQDETSAKTGDTSIIIESTTPYKNVALNAAVKASGQCNDNELPEYAVDGRTDTKWCDNSNKPEKWLELDLGDEYKINQWVVKNACIGESGHCPFRNTNTFRLQKSVDGTKWEDVDVVTDNYQTIVKRYVPTFTSRYVRLFINKGGIKDNHARIYEFELYGTNLNEDPPYPEVDKEPIEYVDPFINTLGDNGESNPGATTPNGLVKLGPDSDGNAHSGYYYEDQHLEGFSHLRVDGVGCNGGGGNILLKPGIGEFTKDRSKYKERYDKNSETASPGYYSVRLNSGIEAELTVSPRVGMHRYTFPQTDDAHVVIDLGRSYATMLDADLKVENNNEISGMIKARNVCDKGHYTLYYSIQFDKDFNTYKTWENDEVDDEKDSRSGSKIGAWIKFNTQENEVIHAKVGISPISVEQAKYERDHEIADWDFDKQHNKTRDAWSQLLNKVEILDGNEEYKTIFYTAIYRSFLLPTNVTSSSGTYRAARDESTIRNTADTAPDFEYYSGWSTWDDFRKFSLISLLEPQKYENIARSLVDMYKTRGTYVQWGDGYWPSPTVRNEFNGALILDAYVKGLDDFDAEDALEGMSLDADNFPISGEQISGKLEKAYSAYFPMKMAYLIGDKATYDKYKLVASYKKLWNPDQKDNQGNIRGFFTPNAQTVTDVEKVNQYAYQGNLWTYRWFVPHDINGLAEISGGRKKMADDLKYFFDIDEYVAVNEPDLHAPYLFNYLGKPYLTQYYARQFTTEVVTQKYHNHGLYDYPIKSRVYRADPEGFLPSMDDDAGAMSSWFVYSAMGLFPSNPGDSHYLIGSPIFPEIRFHLDSGNTFTIKANGVSSDNRYIQRATLNGERFNNAWIDYSTIMGGGTLELEMGDTPNVEWAADLESAPPVLGEWDYEGLGVLTKQFIEMNEGDNDIIESLLSNLTSAKDAEEQGNIKVRNKQLHTFKDQVDTLVGKELTEEQATTLIRWVKTFLDSESHTPSQPILSFSFDGSGKTVKDDSPNGFDGELHGKASRVEDKFGQALRLDDGWVEVPSSSLLNGRDALTVSAWVKLDNPKDNQKMIAKTTTQDGYVLGVKDGKFEPEVWDSQGDRYTFKAGDIPANEWVHVALTRKQGGRMIGYINGEAVANIPAGSSKIKSNEVPLIIGSASWALGRFPVKGLMDEVRIFNDELTSEQIRTLYKMDYDEANSSSEMRTLIKKLFAKGEIENTSVAHSLDVHLTAVEHFEKQKTAQKVLKHMGSFKQLLDHQKENELISEKAYVVLKASTDNVIRKWQ